MQAVTPAMGERVIAKAHLIRKSSYGRDEYGRNIRMKSWERTEFRDSAWTHGIYVGRRMKSNGTAINQGYEEGVEYKPVAYFEVWLVAYADNRDILICLPKDVVLERNGNEQQQQQQ